MRKILFSIAMLVSLSVSTQDSIAKSINLPVNKCIYNVNIDSSVVAHSSTNLNHKGEIHIKSDNKSIFELLFPSLIALLVGLMAFWATIITSRHQRNIIKKQMEDNKSALEKQIESSMKIAELDFRKTVLSANREAWINDFRIVVSELISLVNVCSIAGEDIKDENYKQISFLITKAEFMLNPTKDKDCINAIVKLRDSLFQLSVRQKTYSEVMQDIELVKENTKITLKNEWERVKRAE